MNLYFRLIYMLIASFFKEKLPSALSTGSLYFHVLPTDLDLNGHMNNGRYLTIMDIGRMDFVLRVKLAGYVIKNGYIPVLSSAKMRYRIPLMPFEEYELQTRILCWDDKWVFMEQRFIIADGPKAGVAAAIGLIKGSFYRAQRGQPRYAGLHPKMARSRRCPTRCNGTRNRYATRLKANFPQVQDIGKEDDPRQCKKSGLQIIMLNDPSHDKTERDKDQPDHEGCHRQDRCPPRRIYTFI